MAAGGRGGEGWEGEGDGGGGEEEGGGGGAGAAPVVEGAPPKSAAAATAGSCARWGGSAPRLTAGSVVSARTSWAGTCQQGACAASEARVMTDLKSKGRRTALSPSRRMRHATVARSWEAESLRSPVPMPSNRVSPYSYPM